MDREAANQELEDAARKAGCDYVRFAYADMNGVPKSHLIPIRHLRSTLRDGFGEYSGIFMITTTGGIVMKDIASIATKGFPNCQVKAEPGTLRVIPWDCNDKMTVGQVMCHTYWSADNPQASCPRFVAQSQLLRLEKHGLSLYSSFEYEFYLLSKGAPIYSVKNYAGTAAEQTCHDLLMKMDQQLSQAGVDIERIQTEYGPGQIEAPLTPAYGMKSADDAFIFKTGVKVLASNDSKMATFMSFPVPNEIGCSGHFNHSLWNKDGENVLYDSKSEDGLSQIGKHWLAGLVKHGEALTVLNCPTFNCYRRLHKLWLPTVSNWALDNRTVAFRAKSVNPKSTYFESRSGSSAANPYIVLAGTVAAGLDGIENKLTCPSPVADDAPKLPKTLAEGVNALKADDIICEALGKEFIDSFCSVKELEIEQFKNVDINKSDDLDLEIKEYQLLI